MVKFTKRYLGGINVVEEKYCCLYVNNMHLIVMLIPYIEKVLEENEIITIFEDSLEDEVSLFLNKVNISKSKKNKLKKMNWNQSLLSEEQIKKISGKIVLIKGSYNYVKNINDCFEKNGENKIINCFMLEEFETNSREILEKHDAILNTLGVKKISEMFKTNAKMGMKF